MFGGAAGYRPLMATQNPTFYTFTHIFKGYPRGRTAFIYLYALQFFTSDTSGKLSEKTDPRIEPFRPHSSLARAERSLRIAKRSPRGTARDLGSFF